MGTTERNRSTLDKGLLGPVPKIFETSSCQRNDLAFCVFCVFFVRFDVLVRNALDHLHQVVRFGDIRHQSFVLRL